MAKTFTALAASALMLVTLAAFAPAQASTAHQYMAQGRGHYVSSKKRVGGMGYRHHRHHHRHMYRR